MDLFTANCDIFVPIRINFWGLGLVSTIIGPPISYFIAGLKFFDHFWGLRIDDSVGVNLGLNIRKMSQKKVNFMIKYYMFRATTYFFLVRFGIRCCS